MKANVIPLEPEKFYHIYNRGIDGCSIFKKDSHYTKFLEKYAYHLVNVVETYAYCLLGNHFHFLVRIKSEEVIRNSFPHLVKSEIDELISKQFAHLFNGYAQYFNHATERTGGLFEAPFRRILVDSDSYFSRMVYYIHANPQKHSFLSDFRDYPYSSYHSHLSQKATKLERESVLSWFGDKDIYTTFHGSLQDLSTIEDLMIDFE
jgi:REP element-mobilizing transposase RayT